ncbi:hypothetical protein RRG08_050536 [Elysia crispata]|uniref:Uncharacterized protein n=1 Tax=Elysia crispata TaxID=231223 RepID=A0AAE0ZV94_9GAST|nr:hypothetical protein RRG08_050536 [Elysia crispata]
MLGKGGTRGYGDKKVINGFDLRTGSHCLTHDQADIDVDFMSNQNFGYSEQIRPHSQLSQTAVRSSNLLLRVQRAINGSAERPNINAHSHTPKHPLKYPGEIFPA